MIVRARTPVLVLIPPACCGAGYFRRVRRALGGRAEIHGLELPGHGRRYEEDMLTSAAAALRDVEERLPTSVDVVYGESLGAYIALALLSRRSDPDTVLVAASNSAPSVRDDLDLDGIDSVEGAITRLLELGGDLPPELVNDRSVAEGFYHLIHSDLLLSQGFITMTREAVVDGDLLVLGGEQDVGLGALEAWKGHTRSRCEVFRIPGPHLLSGNNPHGVAEAIAAVLGEDVRNP
ncbi:thioesterase II family protein [Actinopolyspora mortivallis]|uniref:Thioesterase domain-containing protein n=1 Tax=Actinopolyspora mortivallis TaxID=33906 RepID=A0A2T0GZX1_ACTMO|nr:alpha/beta fold hydrolase [Actinopolyspora mortivallis]PRW64658.1 hypothetical protein CEP50_04755 [Actinopolyspora mortivallis]